MKTAAKIFLYISLALVLVWILPWAWRIATLKSYSTPFTLYSCVVHDFTSLDRDDKDLTFIDRNGNVYTDEVQPLFYGRVLNNKGALPDSLEGRPITLALIDSTNVNFSAKPEEFNTRLIPVCLLMESVPVRMELQDPEGAFVLHKDRIVLYDITSNTLEEEKSRAFSDALASEGFVYPVVQYSGNPSHHKLYDEGYLLIDSAGNLFQLKQVDGKPYARRFSQADAINVKYVNITELSSRATLGWFTDDSNRMYFLSPDGLVYKTEVSYNPEKESLLGVGDLFYYTIKTSDDDGEHFYALRSDDFSLVDTMDRPYDFDEGFNLCKYLFPCRLYFTSSKETWVRPHFVDFSWIGLIVDLLAIGAVILIRQRRKSHK